MPPHDRSQPLRIAAIGAAGAAVAASLSWAQSTVKHGGVPVAPVLPPSALTAPLAAPAPSAFPATPAVPVPVPSAKVGSGTAAGPQRDLEPAVYGRAYAHRDCAQCHAVEPGTKSADPHAVAFDKLSGIAPGAFHSKFQMAAKNGHHTGLKPPPREEILQIGAYLRSLKEP